MNYLITGFKTLTYLHRLHKDCGFSYKQIGKMAGYSKKVIYEFLHQDHLTDKQDQKIRRNIGEYIMKMQENYLSTYK